MKTATLKELSDLVGGIVSGDENKEIRDIAPLQTAEPDTISFLADVHKIRDLSASRAGAILVPIDFIADQCPSIQVPDVVAAFEKITLFFRPQRTDLVQGISPKADIAPSVQMGNDVKIGSGVSVGEEVVLGDHVVLYPGVVIMSGSSIGENTIVFPNAVIYENCVIGKNCLIHSGAVIGAYGFGYDSSSGEHILSRQWGNVVLEDRVEVGACSTIDRGTYASTRIGYGTKIDNLVMIAHNCQLGRHNLICASTGVAGSTTTGDYVVMAGRVGVRDHVHIGTGAVLGAMAGIMASVPEGAKVVGIPATPDKQQMRIQVAIARLPEMRQELKEMQKNIQKLLEKMGD
ncbi:MAG: UDP-3-O-(3-hydroxymyristoyl)glucosamine N-acyltransferase [Planctomycetia bacterium]|nr:UDP-3-O-(3-hydroxymyristoyl)glucosamine N-acyltransferase [Planctomycetia bacterium]